MPDGIVNAPAKPKEEHFTPLKPGMKLSDLRPELKDKSLDQLEDEKALAQRIKAVVIVKDLPPSPRLHLTVATLKTGKYQVLYCGSDRAAADKEAVFDPKKHSKVEIFFQPVPSKKFDRVRGAVVHHDPLKPHETMKQYLARTNGEPVPAVEAKPSPASDPAMDQRLASLEKLSSADLKAAVLAAGLTLEGCDDDPLDGEDRGDLIMMILENEFPGK